ncbi:MAG TPA: diacylglycerol kinase family protein [Longimicrobiaceae bacterium]|nr:diacylglycerol kinase family protein [Longimicrobiaceae bacterium]
MFVNARAGYLRGSNPGAVERALREAGVPVEVRGVAAADLGRALTKAVRDGVDRVGVAGGDGTQLIAAQALAGTGTALVPVPTGTLNHFARRVGIPDLATAAAALAGPDRSMPLGVVDDELFLNTATLGLYADVVRRRERRRRWMTKWPAAALAFAEALARLRHLDLALEVDGEHLERRTPLLWVGVGWGSFPFVHEAPERRRQPDLEIVVLRPGSRLGALALMARLSLLLHGRERPVEDPALEVLHARRLVVRAHHPIGVTLDGEVRRLRAPVLLAVQDAALRVCAPPSAGRAAKLPP